MAPPRPDPALVVDLGGTRHTLPADGPHYLISDGRGLNISRTGDDTPGRQMGFFVPMVGRWFFSAGNVPAARALRIDGGPVVNTRQELPSDRPIRVSLQSDVPTGPLRPRTPVDGHVAVPLVDRKPPPARSDRPGRDARRYVIGRTRTNADIEIDDPLVRARHAEVRIDSKGRWWISGEMYVDGVRHMSAVLSEGQVFVIGQTAVTVSRDLLPRGAQLAGPAAAVRAVPTVRRRPTADTGLAVRLRGVSVWGHHGTTRLDDVTLDIEAGEVVAVVGPSGAGKSSLIEVLLGELAEQEGTVTLGPGGRTDIGLRRRHVRYVPQGDDGLFPALTVAETLEFAARLRAAPDTSPAVISERVGQVLRRLGLDHIGQNPVKDISGGQKRRVSIGTELVGDPQLLLLDEPTSGLDPGKDRAIMTDLRVIAETYRCTVIIVTHATEHLEYVDKVITVGKGGRVRDAGAPAGVLAALGHDTWADLMIELDTPPPQSPQRAAAPTTARTVGAPAARPDLAGLRTLTARQFVLTLRRGRIFLATLVAGPVVCTGLAVVASPEGLRPGTAMGSVLAILVTVAALTGTSLTYPDIVNDAGKLRRDFRVGVETLPIVLSKAIVYTVVCAVLAALIAGLFSALRELPPRADGLPPLVMLYLVVLLIMLASMGLGLFISTVASSLEMAVAWSTLLAVLQVSLSGTLFHLKGVFGVLTAVLPARLGLAAVASYADFNRYRRPALYTDWLWNPGATHFWLLILGLLVVEFLAVAAAVGMLHRRWTAR